MAFHWNCSKICRVAFCLVLQFTAHLLGKRKKHKDSFPQAPGFCADDVFIIAVYFNTDILPGRKSSISPIHDKGRFTQEG